MRLTVCKIAGMHEKLKFTIMVMVEKYVSDL